MWIEQIEKRTRNGKHFLDSIDRRKHAIDVSIGSIHYKENPKSDLELWKDIDTRISEDGKVDKAPYRLEIYLSDMPGFHYTSRESGKFIVRLNKARQDKGLPDTIPVNPHSKPVIEGSKVIWKDFYPDTDVILEAQNTQVHLKRLIKTNKAPREFDIDIQEIKAGVAKLRPLLPATDANGQRLVMEETARVGGRNERLKLEVVADEPNPKPIVFPILDNTTIDEQVTAGDDDADENGEGTLNRTRDSVIIVSHSDPGAAQYSCGGVRFQTIPVPNGVEITTAYETIYTSGGTAYDDINCVIYGNDVDDADDFLTNANIISTVNRPRTTASVSWVQNALGGFAWVQGPEIKTIIKEIVDGLGWAVNQNMVLLHIANSDVYKECRGASYEYHADYGFKLHIEYPAAGWTGKIAGVVNPAAIAGVAVANIASVKGVA